MSPTLIALLSPALMMTASLPMAQAPAAETGLPTEPADRILTPQELEEVLAQRDRYERLTVPVVIAGQGPYRFMVDTGAQSTVVTQRVIDDLGIQPDGKATLVAMGSSAVVPTIRIGDLEFANRRIDGLRAALLNARNVGADGILGLDSLQDMRVLIDFDENRITVADAHDDLGNDGFEIVVRARRQLGQMIITDARINNVRTNVIIDSGAQRSFGNQALRRRLLSQSRGMETAKDVHGFEMTNELREVERLSLGKITLEGLQLAFAQSPVFAALGLEDRPALVLGVGDLAAFRRVAIDFATRKVMFDLPTDLAHSFLRRREAGFREIGNW